MSAAAIMLAGFALGATTAWIVEIMRNVERQAAVPPMLTRSERARWMQP